MRASIIINTCNRAEHLKRLVPGLLHLTGEAIEIVVVNGPSTDGTEAVLESFSDAVKAVSCPVMNLSVSRNIGIAEAAGDIVVFIDDDALPGDTFWIERYLRAFTDDPHLGSAAGAVLAYDTADYEYLGGATTAYGFQRFDAHDPCAVSPDGTPWVERGQGCNCAFRRSALTAIGGYDERFRFWLDETDVFFRLHKNGFTYRFLADNPVRHYPTRTQFKMGLPPDKWSVITRSDTYFSIKNGGDPFFRRIARTLRLAPEKYYCRKIREYTQGGMLTRKERIPLCLRWLRGLVEGLFYGICTKRRTVVFDGAPEPFKTIAYHRPEKKLSIALLSAELPSPAGCGGIGRYTLDLARGLHQLGHEVHLISRSPQPLHHESLAFFLHGLSDDEIGRWKPVSKHHELNYNLFYALTVQRRLDDLVRAGFHFDAVHATNWNAEALAVIQAGKFPVCLTLVTSLAADVVVMEWPYTDERRSAIAADYRQILQAAQLCAPSKGVLESYRTLMNLPADRLAETAIVPLGIAPQIMPEPPPAAPDRPKTLLFVGRCERRKGVHVLLEVLPELLTKHPDWQCVLIGNTSIRDVDGQTFMERFIRTAPPETAARIHFRGICTEEEIHRAYQQCDLFTAPSLFESFGLIYLEAMQYGKAVVGCRTGGVPEVVHDGVHGLLTPPGDAPALFQALDRLMSDPAERARMGQDARARVLTAFTHIHMAERYLAVYQQMRIAPRVVCRGDTVMDPMDIPDASVLVTTAGKRLYRVNLRTGRLDVLGVFPGKLYGFSWDENGTFYLSESGHTHDDIRKASQNNDFTPVRNGVIHVFRNDGNHYVLPGGFVDTHQILYERGALYVCNTGLGTLEKLPVHEYDTLRNRVILLETGPDCIGGEWRGEHINSVHLEKDGSIRYIRHRHGKSAVCTLNRGGLDESHEIFEAHKHALIGDDVLVCNSRHGKLYSLNTRKTVWTSPISNAFARGLACIGEQMMVIGLSKFDPEQSLRSHNTGYLAVVRRSPDGRFTTHKVLALPDSGDVYEVRTLDLADPWTHNGITLPGDTIRQLAHHFPA